MDSIVSTKDVESIISNLIKQALSKIDLAEAIRDATRELISQRLGTISFPQASIPHESINWDDFSISGDRVFGGIHTEFSSQGIDDLASSCRLTIMDECVVVEPELVTDSVSVKGNLILSGELVLKGPITDESKALTEFVDSAVIKNLRGFDFEKNSIPFSAIRWGSSTISGDQVVGGMHVNFSSQGIDDQATECKLTIMDDFVVVENSLVAQSVEVKRDLEVDGTFVLNGAFDQNSLGYQELLKQTVSDAKEVLTNEVIEAFSTVTAQRITESGIDLKRITIENNTVIDGNSLGKFIVNSNLQKLGQLRELQVRGESQLGETLYVSNKRVGVNTIDPSRALSVWEEECEIVLGKHERQTGYIGSIRTQKVVLGSDGQTNIILDVDGSTRIFELLIGDTKLQSADTMPNHNGTRGEIVFNSAPELGKPFGWMCLGEARWACMPALTG